jgi:hypothetical protein
MIPEQAAAQRAVLASSESQVAAQKATYQAQKSAKVPPRSQSPANGSSDDDELSQPEWKWPQTKSCMRRNKAWIKQIAASAIALPAPEPLKALPAPDLKALPAPESAPRTPTPLNSDDEDMFSEDQKRHMATATKISKRIQLRERAERNQLQRHRPHIQWQRERWRAELEACDQGAA